MGGSVGGAELCCWYTVTAAAPEEKEEAEDEAVAAFTTPLVMISLILLTAPKKKDSSQCVWNTDKRQQIKREGNSNTVNKLSGLSLDVQIQRSVSERKQQRDVQASIACHLFNHLCFLFLERRGNSPWESFGLLFCRHVTASGWHSGAAHFTNLKRKHLDDRPTKTEQTLSGLKPTSSCVCPRVRRFRQVMGTSLISTSATTRSSFAFGATGGFPMLITWTRNERNKMHKQRHLYNKRAKEAVFFFFTDKLLERTHFKTKRKFRFTYLLAIRGKWRKINSWMTLKSTWTEP